MTKYSPVSVQKLRWNSFLVPRISQQKQQRRRQQQQQLSSLSSFLLVQGVVVAAAVVVVRLARLYCVLDDTPNHWAIAPNYAFISKPVGWTDGRMDRQTSANAQEFRQLPYVGAMEVLEKVHKNLKIILFPPLEKRFITLLNMKRGKKGESH